MIYCFKFSKLAVFLNDSNCINLILSKLLAINLEDLPFVNLLKYID